MEQDEAHLRLLSIFHYVVGGLTALFSLFPVFHLVMGLVFIFASEGFFGGGEAPPAFVGWFFVIFSVLFITAGMALAICIIITGRFLASRSHHLFCVVIGGIECIFMPFGTVLGVFTIIVLMRKSVKELFC